MRSELECENRDFSWIFRAHRLSDRIWLVWEAFGSAFPVLEGSRFRGGEFTEVDLACWQGGGCEIAGRLALRCLGLGKQSLEGKMRNCGQWKF